MPLCCPVVLCISNLNKDKQGGWWATLAAAKDRTNGEKTEGADKPSEIW